LHKLLSYDLNSLTDTSDRLRATGVVDIQNPVTKARQEGRFEELPDDPESD
jgi:hypothetical protein